MEKVIKEFNCQHCGERFEVYEDDRNRDHQFFCSPDCLSCHETRKDSFWADPCDKHKEVADKRNEEFLKNNSVNKLN